MRRWFWVAVAVQVIVLYAPRAAGPDTGLPLDKVAHVAIFAGVVTLGIRAGYPARWLIPIMVVQALASEWIQARVLTERSGDFGDIMADIAGIGLGAIIGLRGREKPHNA